MKKLFLLALPALLFAHDLRSLIEAAQHANHTLKAAAITTEAKQKELDSQKSSYYPTLDISAAYLSFDKVNPFQAGNTLNLYTKAGIDLYDGFRKRALVKQKSSALSASQHDYRFAQKRLTMQIINDFFTIKSAEASLQALKEKSRQLYADIKKVRQLKAAGLVAREYVDKLQAAYDANLYQIESLKLNIRTMKQYLSLESGVTVTTLDAGKLQDPETLSYRPSEALQAMQQQAEALSHAAEAVGALYAPQVRLEDTYSHYDYSRDKGVKAFGIEQVENQNKLMLSANLHLYDNGTLKKQKQALRLQKQALMEKIARQKEQEQIEYRLAHAALQTARTNIKSALSAMKAANSVYKSTKAKFNAGLVDQVTYLDALSQKIAGEARYSDALNRYEIAKANYYFKANSSLKERIQ